MRNNIYILVLCKGGGKKGIKSSVIKGNFRKC